MELGAGIALENNPKQVSPGHVLEAKERDSNQVIELRNVSQEC